MVESRKLQKTGGSTLIVSLPKKWTMENKLKAGAEVRNLGDVKWLATEDKSQGKGTGRHIACFILKK